MPFGLINAPAVFQYMMNDIFQEYLDPFVVRMENYLVHGNILKKYLLNHHVVKRCLVCESIQEIRL
jgi:hypothetical protein